jgi:hypothetical protein
LFPPLLNSLVAFDMGTSLRRECDSCRSSFSVRNQAYILSIPHVRTNQKGVTQLDPAHRGRRGCLTLLAGTGRGGFRCGIPTRAIHSATCGVAASSRPTATLACGRSRLDSRAESLSSYRCSSVIHREALFSYLKQIANELPCRAHAKYGWQGNAAPQH